MRLWVPNGLEPKIIPLSKPKAICPTWNRLRAGNARLPNSWDTKVCPQVPMEINSKITVLARSSRTAPEPGLRVLTLRWSWVPWGPKPRLTVLLKALNNLPIWLIERDTTEKCCHGSHRVRNQEWLLARTMKKLPHQTRTMSCETSRFSQSFETEKYSIYWTAAGFHNPSKVWLVKEYCTMLSILCILLLNAFYLTISMGSFIPVIVLPILQQDALVASLLQVM
jgi:hypothetical protein